MINDHCASIAPATTPGDYATFAAFIREYVEWCRSRYADEVEFLDDVFGWQALDEELTKLPVAYGPPSGRTLLASRGGQAVGCVAYRRLADGACEMKRLFVPSRFQAGGIGRILCRGIMAAARDEGFSIMRLDTGHRFTEAIGLYVTCGFSRCAPYHAYPPAIAPFMVFMETSLVARSPRTASGSPFVA